MRKANTVPAMLVRAVPYTPNAVLAQESSRWVSGLSESAVGVGDRRLARLAVGT